MYNSIMMIPRLIINFKNYKNATGDNALYLAKIVEQVSKESGVLIGICVNALELCVVAKSVNIPVFLQNCDFYSFGPHSGAIIPELSKFYGAFGVLLNHIERPLEEESLKKTIIALKKVGIKSLVCADNFMMASKIYKFSPDILLIEECEFMGSCTSITERKPELIDKAFKRFGENSFMIGAGVSQKKHVKTALDRGAYGVIVSSAVVNSIDPGLKLRELIEPIKNMKI